MWMDEQIKGWCGKLAKTDKVAFCSAFIGGMLAHLYAYTNTIPNFDGVSRVYDEQQLTIFGRWFLHYASYLHGFAQIPMLIGVVSMFFLALTAVLVVKCTEIKSCFLAAVWGIISVIFPAVAFTNGYIFTVDVYSLSVFLAVLAVWVTSKRKWGFLLASVLLAFSMGIYQVYVTAAIAMSLLLVIKQVLRAESKVKDIWLQGIRYVGFLGIGTLLYYGILKVFLKVKDIELAAYLGIADVEAGYPIDQLGSTIAKTYKQVFTFFFTWKEQGAFTNQLPVVIHIILVALLLVLLVHQVVRTQIYKSAVKLVALPVLIGLLPMAVNFGQMISPYSTPSPLMMYSCCFLYLFVILMMNDTVSGRGFEKTRSLLFTVCFLVLGGYYWQYDNTLYMMLEHAQRVTFSFVTNVVSRVENCEGYETGMDVVIIGGFPSDRYHTDLEAYANLQIGGAQSTSVIPMNKHIYYYLNDWLNVPIEEPAEELSIEIAASEEFKAMPLYPNDGSVRIIDGVVVVKMQETFTPKAQYEKDYEQRR